MSTEHESLESKKAMAFDLFTILDQEPEKESYTPDEIKKIITAYIVAVSNK